MLLIFKGALVVRSLFKIHTIEVYCHVLLVFFSISNVKRYHFFIFIFPHSHLARFNVVSLYGSSWIPLPFTIILMAHPFSHLYHCHTWPFYYIHGKHPIHIASPPFYLNAIRSMTTNEATNEEGFQAKSLKHGIHSLNYHIAIFLNHVVGSSWSHHIIYF